MKKILVTVLLALPPCAAQAADAGAYVFGSLGYNAAKPSSFTVDTPDRKAGGAAFELGGGYRVNQIFAIEASYAYLGKPEISYDNTFSGSFKLNAFRVSALGIVPINDELSAFGRISLNYMQIAPSGQIGGNAVKGETRYDARTGVGLGLSYSLNKNLSVLGDYEYIYVDKDHTGLDGISLIKAGLRYQF
ncbi:hypothetical protein BUE93_09340 [Chromobacterium amazonense]|uniref:Outer membrane protein beta-barrel domain-containing protein n=1 Tax=Chromobacterium amazonense TaxID=1382803 RepID=A0A2S9X5D8_9NEIS|nr:porin family protein [Chromobacterium amazonense]PRP70929.1 hypothetical protein BUE93_09340 [Chromobacterium amazonense]